MLRFAKHNLLVIRHVNGLLPVHHQQLLQHAGRPHFQNHKVAIDVVAVVFVVFSVIVLIFLLLLFLFKFFFFLLLLLLMLFLLILLLLLSL